MKRSQSLLAALVLLPTGLFITGCTSVAQKSQRNPSSDTTVENSKGMLLKEEYAQKTTEREDRQRYLSELESQRDRRTRGY